MLKPLLILELLTVVCNAQNDLYPQHPDEVLRQVAEPSAASVARRALRGLSISEVIKGVYPTLPTPTRNSPAVLKSEPSAIEQLPVPESLRQNAAPEAQSIVPSVATAVRAVQDPPPTPATIPFANRAQPLLLENRRRAPPALNIQIVSSPIQTPTARQNVVDLNILPRSFQAQPQEVPRPRIVANRPAANIRVVPAPSPSRTPSQASPNSGRRGTINQRSDSSDDYYESYEFGYEIRTPEGTHSHEERKIPTGQVFGSYSMALADGRQRLVTYSADEDGFHPIVETNELGTLTSEPADAKIISTAPSSGPEASTQTVARAGTFGGIREIRRTNAKKTST